MLVLLREICPPGRHDFGIEPDPTARCARCGRLSTDDEVAAQSRIDSVVDELAGLLERMPGLRDRTAAMLVGDLDCPDLPTETAMPKKTRGAPPPPAPKPTTEKPTNLRLSGATLERAEALAERLTALRVADPLAPRGKVSRHEVLVMSIDLGLAEVERLVAGREVKPAK